MASHVLHHSLTNASFSSGLCAVRGCLQEEPAWELVAVPAPDNTVTEPPCPTVPVPADTATIPPAPESPEPTAKEMAPPGPLVADPVTMLTLPLAPALVVPELNTSGPLTPLAPALAEEMTMPPLEVEEVPLE